MKDHLKAGKGIVFLHQALVNRANSKELSQISGLAFSWNKADRSSWGKFTADIHLDESHPIFKGMSKVLKIFNHIYLETIKFGVMEKLLLQRAIVILLIVIISKRGMSSLYQN